MQQRGLLAQGDRVDGGQYADGGAHPDPAGAAEQQRGQGDGGRTGAVRHEVVLGQPYRVEPGLLGDLRRADRPVQGLPLALARKLGAQHKASYVHRISRFLGSDPSSPTGITV